MLIVIYSLDGKPGFARVLHFSRQFNADDDNCLPQRSFHGPHRFFIGPEFFFIHLCQKVGKVVLLGNSSKILAIFTFNVVENQSGRVLTCH
ncbi:hypothetical protein Y032_0071g580 [Ancylostoma ceylanicum]|uniref:Uncharacterized protein n=1 Tax=Ancylostoma ceylanicum TaxID=53326 RepID=A0A016TXE9_9BILA|nr:hypothetical protein Y032_0071g580 [Ancylostoma ceylanicum]